MTDTYYGTIDAARLAGVSVRQLTHWADLGYLRPIREVGHGYGGKRYQWDMRDIDAASRFGALSAALGLGGSRMARTFSRTLAVPYDPDLVGVMVDVGRFTVTVEVRTNEAANA